MRNIIIPAYEYPGAGWDVVFKPEHVGQILIAILNPASGVGSSPSNEYQKLIQRLVLSGIGIGGYIATTYGARSPIDIQSEITKWRDWYGVGSIFFDETSTELGLVSYYRRLCGMVKTQLGPSALTMLNPGTLPDPSYASIADIICTAESSQDGYLGKIFPTWEQAAKAYHIVYGVTNPTSVFAAMARNKADYYYLTSIGGNDPQYDVTHTIFPAETPTPTAPITENEATKILIETSNIIGLGVNQTLKDVPARARTVMDELRTLGLAPSLRTATNEQVIGEALRRMK